MDFELVRRTGGPRAEDRDETPKPDQTPVLRILRVLKAAIQWNGVSARMAFVLPDHLAGAVVGLAGAVAAVLATLGNSPVITYWA